MDSFSRAISPLATATLLRTTAEATVAAAPPAQELDASLVARHQAISRASSVDEVISLVPPGWREALSGELRATHRMAALREEKRARYEANLGHKANGTYPSHIPSGRPHMAGSKELRATAEGSAIEARMQQTWDSMRNKMLDEAIATTKMDYEITRDKLNDQTLWSTLSTQVAKAAPGVEERRKIAVFGQEGTSAPPVAFVTSPIYEQERTAVLQDLLLWANQVILLATSRHWLDAEKKSKKKAAKDAAAAASMDVDPSSGNSSIEKEVKRAVDRNLKKLRKLQVRPSLSALTQTCEKLTIDFFVAESSRACRRRFLQGTWDSSRRKEEEEEATRAFEALSSRCRRHCCHRPIQEGLGESEEGCTSGDAEGEEGQGESQGCRVTAVYMPGFIRQRKSDARDSFLSHFLIFLCNKNVFCRCALHESEGPFGHIGYNERILCEVHFNFEQPLTYPDWFLEIDRDEMCHHIVTRTPLHILEASRFRNTVHLSTGVTMPIELQVHLAVGMKYMLPPTNYAHNALIGQYDDLCNRLLWRIHFLFENGGQDTDDYDPDFEVEHDTPPAPLGIRFRYLQHGFAAGKKVVQRAVDDVQNGLNRSFPNANLKPVGLREGLVVVKPQFRAVRQYLLDNDLIVTGTDKNLGIAVSKRQWYIQKCLDLLQNDSDYKELSQLEADDYFKGQCDSMERLAKIVESWDESYIKGSTQLPRYLRSLLPAKGERPHVPKFHGIPKIHKKPTAMRPIIPCHSSAINPAAKFVHKVLAPILKDRHNLWSVCESSRQLAEEVRHLELPPYRKVYLCTGDVVAMYPNIPLQECIRRCTVFAKKWYALCANERITSSDFWDAFELAAQVGNSNLITQFEGKFYLQKRGLAMGVADSPVLANLYSASTEVPPSRLPKHKYPAGPLLFYRRYIDDCFCIVLAQSECEARTFVETTVSIDGCVIKWDVSAMSCVFLDLWIYLNPSDPTRVHFKPYRKANNHRERLPWISHHPIDVKKGTFVGELSRLAALSSSLKHYRDAVSDLVSLYIARGYPTGWINEWARSNMERRWETRYESSNRVEDEDRPGSFVVLKSTFNPAVNLFRANELAETVIGEWRKYCNWYALGSGPVPKVVSSLRGTYNPAPHADDIAYSANLPEEVVMYRHSGESATEEVYVLAM